MILTEERLSCHGLAWLHLAGRLGLAARVALIRFPGGFGPLEIVHAGDVFLRFFDVFSIVFCTSIFTQFYRFGGYFGHEFWSILACCFAVFLILFLHSLENVDFIKIAVFLQKNNVFHSSECSKILYFYCFLIFF